MYEPPLLNLYEDAILRNGDPRSFTATLNPTSAGRARVSRRRSPTCRRASRCRTQSIIAVDADFDSQYALMTNVQIERAIGQDFSVSLGYVNSIGRSMPVLIDTNIIPTGLTLGDGRPIYSTAVNASTRVNPAFNHVDTLSVDRRGHLQRVHGACCNKRMSHGVQLQASYTWAKGEDDAPLTGTYVVGSGDDRLSDPSNQDRDKGVVPFNQTHTFVMSTLIAPRVSGSGFWRRLADNNQLGLILHVRTAACPSTSARTSTSTSTASPTTGRSASTATRAASGRSSTSTPATCASSRWARACGPSCSSRPRTSSTPAARTRRSTPPATINISAVNRVVTTNAAGQPAAAIPDPFAGTAGYQQRQVQLGAKLSF